MKERQRVGEGMEGRENVRKGTEGRESEGRQKGIWEEVRVHKISKREDKREREGAKEREGKGKKEVKRVDLYVTYMCR